MLVQDKFVVVMSSTGVMYSQPVIPACNAVEGPVYFTIDLSVSYPSRLAGTASPQGEDEVRCRRRRGGGLEKEIDER